MNAESATSIDFDSEIDISGWETDQARSLDTAHMSGAKEVIMGGLLWCLLIVMQ